MNNKKNIETLSTTTRPLVTFALFFFNQESYVRDAVLSALGQDYRPIQIILSDDYSSDLTYELIKEIIDDYSGDAEIIVRQNEANLGLAEHINEVFKLSKGDFIVFAAGDDLSAPNRSSTLVKYWIEQNKPAAVFSAVNVIDENGQTISARYDHHDERIPIASECNEKIIKELILSDKNVLLGCSEAFSRDVFEVLGPLNGDVVNEDNALSFRCWILGGILYINETLVAYRVHGRNLAHKKLKILTTPKEFKTNELQLEKNSFRALKYIKQYQSDLLMFEKLDTLENHQITKYRSWINTRLTLEELRTSWRSLSIFKRFIAIISHPTHTKFLSWAIPRIFGIDTYSCIRSCASRCYRRIRQMRCI